MLYEIDLIYDGVTTQIVKAASEEEAIERAIEDARADFSIVADPNFNVMDVRSLRE